MSVSQVSCWVWEGGGDLEKTEEVLLKMFWSPWGGNVCIKGTDSNQICGSVG